MIDNNLEPKTYIQYLNDASTRPCSNPRTPIILGSSESENTAMAIRAYCKMWSCPECATRNAKKWVARIINGCNKMDTVDGWFMFTLTAHEKWRGRDSSAKNLRQGWKKLYNRIRRKYGTNSYCKVWEMHKDGTYHLHGLIDAQIPTKWLKNSARQCGMGYQVEIHRVDNAGQVAGYIAKYFLKSEDARLNAHGWTKNLRRIEVSRNWLQLPDIPDNDWAWRIAESETFAEHWLGWQKSYGRKVIDRREKNESLDISE